MVPRLVASKSKFTTMTEFTHSLPSSRRKFLKVAAAGAVGALWSSPGHAADIPTVKLAKGLDVPLLGMGTGVRAGNRSNAFLVFFRFGRSEKTV